MSCARLLESGRARLEASWRSWHTELAPALRAVPAARRFVDEHAAQLPDGEREALSLLTSELVTNAVTHARSSVGLGVTVASNGVLVVVHDGDSLLPEQRPYTAEQTGGRGLALVADVADEWGVEPDDPGKSVWFTLLGSCADDRWRVGDD